jgi:hypothetical protein
MRLTRTATLAATAAIAMLLFAAPALGAGSATSPSPSASTSGTKTSSAPVQASAGGPCDVQFWPGQEGQTVVITVVEVPAETKLPAVVRIPVVPGTTVQWAGEIIGQDASQDIQQQFKLVDGVGGQFAEFTLTKSTRGQIDSIGFPLKISGDMVSVNLDWVQTTSAPLTAISVRLPANVSKVQISPKPAGDPVTNAVGESLYTLNPKAFKPGEKQPVAISYSTTPVPVKQPGSAATPILIGLGIALVVVVIGLFVLLSRQNSAASSTDEEFEPESAQSESEPEEPSVASDSDDDEPFLDFD